ncbi:hypothetical protein [Sporosarcina sp. G11-34]|uniref:hypothetical protein n=1 Tax=Sporosarcina sp. G11-34 TaxID=2849605 RepID=UPI0022A9E902|nr:hypothetical protein [Sporosarcina sp. G11-34]MCZ2258081.1 hypothetical protein [Sporosarcina sp. G11-34]
MDPANYIKDMLGITEGTIVDTAMDVSVGIAPLIGKVYQSFQMLKLQKRMQENIQQLQTLKNKIESSENEVFYKQEVFPLIVKKLIEEDEDIKATVIIDGFEYVIDNGINEIERFYHYYDVLSELRFSDIVILIEDYMPYEMRKNPSLKIKFPTDEEMRSNKYKEQETIKTYQKNKMVRLGLIENRVANIDGGDFNEEGKMSLIREKTIITDFGIRFLKFFALDASPEKPE